MKPCFRILILTLILCFPFYLSVSAQKLGNSATVEQELKEVLAEWVQHANKKDFKAMRAMLTEDYSLFQNGRRYTKAEALEMIKGSNLSDIRYELSKVSSGSGGNIGYLTFDKDWHGKVNGQATDAKAMEIHIFRKESNNWKMQAKSLVMMDALTSGQVKLGIEKAKAEKEIMAIEDEYVALGQKSDFKGIAAFMEKYAIGNSGAILGNGAIGDKGAALKGLRAMAEKNDPDQRYEIYKQEERQVEVYGDAALFSAKAIWRTQGDAKAGKEPREARFTHFFVKQEGVWKWTKAHITDIPPQ